MHSSSYRSHDKRVFCAGKNNLSSGDWLGSDKCTIIITVQINTNKFTGRTYGIYACLQIYNLYQTNILCKSLWENFSRYVMSVCVCVWACNCCFLYDKLRTLSLQTRKTIWTFFSHHIYSSVEHTICIWLSENIHKFQIISISAYITNYNNQHTKWCCFWNAA